MNSVFRRLCAGLIGLVFLFSGIMKLMDPVGTGLIVEEYFKFFRFPFLLPLSKSFGVVLSFVEATCGAGLVTGVWKRFFALISSMLIVFFTTVSLILFVANPEMECGCFGEFIHLSHLQTLLKNVVLLFLALCAFLPVRYLWPAHIDKYVAFGLCELLLLFFTVISLRYIPLADFTDFRPSHTIVSENELIQSDEYPVLPVWDANGNDRSADILYGDVAVMSVYDPDKFSTKQRLEAARFIQDAFSAGYNPVLISTGELEIPGLDSFFADYRKVVTMNRSNGGVTFLNNGYIVRKLSSRNYLSYEDMADMLEHDATEMYIRTATTHSVALQGFAITLLAVLLLV